MSSNTARPDQTTIRLFHVKKTVPVGGCRKKMTRTATSGAARSASAVALQAQRLLCLVAGRAGIACIDRVPVHHGCNVRHKTQDGDTAHRQQLLCTKQAAMTTHTGRKGESGGVARRAPQGTLRR